MAKHLLPKHVLDAWNAGNSTGNSSEVVTTTTTTINMPNHTLPQIPVPKDKIDAAVSIPLGFSHNGSQPGVINIAYKEEWVGEYIAPAITLFFRCVCPANFVVIDYGHTTAACV